MDFTKMSARDAITAAYAGAPSVAWEFAGEDKQKKFAKIRKYCPSCGLANTLRDIEPSADNGQCCLRCRCCGHLCKRPKAMLPVGPNHSSSQVSRVNPNQRLARAMEASEIMAAVEALPVEVRLWAVWVYTEQPKEDAANFEGLILNGLLVALNEVEARALVGLRANADAIRVINMVMVSVRDEIKFGRARYKRSDCAAAIGRDRVQFYDGRLWDRIFCAANKKMEDYDAAVLMAVGRVLRKLSGNGD